MAGILKVLLRSDPILPSPSLENGLLQISLKIRALIENTSGKVGTICLANDALAQPPQFEAPRVTQAGHFPGAQRGHFAEGVRAILRSCERGTV